MKYSKTIIGCVLMLLTATTSRADLTVHMTGSTAFRRAAIVAVQNLMGGAGSVTSAFSDGSNVTGANQAILRGTIAPFGTVTVKCLWNGSAAGIQIMDQGLNVDKWMADTNLNGAVVGTPLSVPTPGYDTPSPADMAFSDAFQDATPFINTVLTEPDDKVLGVIGFKWVVGPGTPSTVTNATVDLVRVILGGGMPLSMWTGNIIHSNTGFYVMGRNADSGTRITAFADGYFGITTLPKQFTPAHTNGSSQIDQIKLYPAEVVLGIPYAAGQSGYGSGGTLANVLKTPAAPNGLAVNDSLAFGTNGYFLSYMGINDAATLIGGGGRELAWQGVAYSDANIQQGIYPFWGYEHLYYNADIIGGSSAEDFAKALGVRIRTVDAIESGILEPSMAVKRNTDGGKITHK